MITIWRENYECIMEDEPWYLLRNNYSNSHSLRHYCAGGVEMAGECARYSWNSFKYPCRLCGSLPSEKIQGMYVMLTGDMDANPNCEAEGTKY